MYIFFILFDLSLFEARNIVVNIKKIAKNVEIVRDPIHFKLQVYFVSLGKFPAFCVCT